MVLDEIIAHKREEIAAAKLIAPLDSLRERILDMDPARDFRAALRKPGISLIAEIKRHSPSRGDLLPNVDAVELAGLYEQAGARAISVLTDAKFFKGSLDDLHVVRRSVRIPCLRKDFIIEPYQIYEARAAGADAVLLIARILTDTELKEFLAVAKSLGMAALSEIHTHEEIERAKNAGAAIIGINNRDLDTLTVDVNTTLTLKRFVSGGYTLVSESGIHTRDQVRLLEEGGVDAILVGESLLSSHDIAEKIGELLGRGES